MDIQEMLTRESIRYTLSLYNSIGDRAAYDDLRSVYTEDGQWVLNDGTVITPLDEIIKLSRAGAEKRGAWGAGMFQRHLLGQPVINIVDSNTATSLTYLLILTELGPDHQAVYRDAWRRIGDRWLLSRRVNALEWIRPDSRFGIYGQAEPLAKDDLNLYDLERWGGD